MVFPDSVYAPPGVYTQTIFESPVQAAIQGVRIPVFIGTGNEVLTQTDLQVVRGSSSAVDQQVPQEDMAGRAVVQILQSGQVILGQFDGVRRQVQVRNYPVVTGDGSGSIATDASSISVTINGRPDVVLSVDGARGLLEISTAPQPTDEVRVTYFFNRTDTLTTDDVSAQVSTDPALIRGVAEEPAGGFDVTTGNDELILTIDGVETTISLGTPGLKTAATLVSIINGAAATTSLTASLYETNFGGTAIQFVADESLAVGAGIANSLLGLTTGDSSSRNATFFTFQGPIVDGSNGGITTTDPGKVTVRVNNQIVVPTAVNGTSRAVTLPFAPATGSTVSIEYFFNTWQDTFDYLANINITEILRAGIVPGNSDFIQGADFVLKDDRIVWGTSSLISSGVHTDGTIYFGGDQGGQVSTLLVDQQTFLEETTAVTDTTVNPPVTSRIEFDLPLQPTTGNGRNTPLGQNLFQTVSNSRIDLPTNRPDLVVAYWGFSVEDALERGPVTVTKVEGTRITLQDPVDVGASVFATFYYNTLVDEEYTLTAEVPGPSGIGTYFVEDSNGGSLLTPQFGVKGPALTGVTIEFPSGSELTPDVRIEGGTSGPVEETVTITFSSLDDTIAKYSVPGNDPYFTIRDASDHARLLIDNTALAGGGAGIDLSRVDGIDGLGFGATLLSDEIAYTTTSGNTTYDVVTGSNDSVAMTVDGVVITTVVNAQTGVNAQAYVDAINAEAKLAANAPFLDGATRFLGSLSVSAGEYDTLVFNYTGATNAPTGPVTATIAPGAYNSPTALAAAVNTALDTAILALPATYAGLDVQCTANSEGQLRFTFIGADADLGTFASGTIISSGAVFGDTITIEGVTLTGGLQQTSGGLDFDTGQARATLIPAGVQPADFVTIDGGSGPVILTALGAQTPGGLNFNEGTQATGSIVVSGPIPGDTVVVDGITLTASGAQTPGGLNFDEGTRADGSVTLTGVEYGDTVTIDTSVLGGGLVTFTAGSTQTPGGLDFNVGDRATGTVQLSGARPESLAPFPARPADTLTINGNVLTAIEGPRTPGADDFDSGTRALGSITAVTTALPSTGVLYGDVVTIGGIPLTADNVTTPGGLNFDAGDQATAVINVTAAPNVANPAATITIDSGGAAGGPYILSPAGGPRTSGGNDYDETLPTTAQIAADIAAAINDPANAFAAFSGSAVGPGANDVTVTWTVPGSAANVVTNAAGDPQVGVTSPFAGGTGDEITTATALVAAILDPLNGISASVEAHNTAGTAAVVNLRAVTPGIAGNTIALTSTAGARLTPSAATLLGGVGTDALAATDAAAAIADVANSFSGDVTVTVLVDVLSLTAVTPGIAGNLITLATTAPSNYLLSGSVLVGGVGDDVTAATSLVAAIQDLGNGLVGDILADNAGGTANQVDLEAFTPGLIGNGVNLAESTGGTRMVLSAATLLNGLGDDTTVAASIAAAINDVANGISVTVSAAPVAATVNMTAVTPGNLGNTIATASSDALRLQMSAATLQGGVGTDLSVANSIVAAINDPGNGLSADVVADNAGGTSTTVTVWDLTPGVAGNANTLAESTGGVRITISGATFTGGATTVQVATSIVNAINDALNGLSGLVTSDNSAGTSATVTVTAAVPGPTGNFIDLASSTALRLPVSGATLTGGTGLGGGVLEFLDALTPAEDFAITAGLSTDALPGQEQTKLINGDIARRFTVAGASGALIYDRIILRNRLVPGTGSMAGATQLAQTELRIEGNNAITETGLVPNSEGYAGLGAVVQPATMAAQVGLLDGQVPAATFGDARDGQAQVTFYADGGTTPQNNVFRMNIDGTLVFAEFTDATGTAIPAAGSADVPMGPASIPNTILAQLEAAAASVGLPAGTFVQEGDGIRVTSATSRESSSITVGVGSSHDRLGFQDGATAERTSVLAEQVASALMAHHSATLNNKYLAYDSPDSTYFAALALAGTIRDPANAKYLYLQSQAATVGGLGVSSNISLLAPSAPNGSWLLPGTRIQAEVGDGASGEEGFNGYYVTSSDPLLGSGSANTSLLNNGVGQDGVIGQTYRDSRTGLTFTVLPRAGNASYPTGAGSTFTFEVRARVYANSNLPVNTIPGVELLVTNTTGVGVDDTALVETIERGGNEPSVGDLYYVTYNYSKEDFSVGLYSRQATVDQVFGAASPEYPVSLASYLGIINGAVLVGIKQVAKQPNSNQGSVPDFMAAVDDVAGVLPGGVTLDTLTVLRGDSQDLYTYIKQHVDLESSIRKRAERTAILGTSSGTQLSDVGDLAEVLEADRVRLVYPDIVRLTLTDELNNDRQFLVDGTYLASAFAGNRASPNIDVATPWTNARILGFDSLARILDAVEQNQVAVRGVTVLEDRGSSIRVRQGLTTDVSNVLTKTPTVRTIADEVQRQTRVTLDRFIGVKFLPGILNQIEGRLTFMLKGLQSGEVIAAFTGVRASRTTDPTVVEVEAWYQPVFPLLYIVVTFNLRSSI